MRTIPLWFLLSSHFVSSCSCGQSHGPPSPDAADDVATDSTVERADTAPDRAFDAVLDGQCVTWMLVTVPADMLVVHDAAPNTARSVRIKASYSRNACDEWAVPEVTVDAASRAVTIELRVWRPYGIACPPVAEPDVRWITLRLEVVGTWSVVNAPPAGAAPVTIDVTAPPRRECGADPGTLCAMDCDCPAGERCLSAYGAVAVTDCMRPCEVLLDCEMGTCAPYDKSDALACQTVGGGCGSCPAGFECVGGVEGISTCQPTFELNSSTRHACGCDADCAPPLRCVDFGLDRAPQCEMRCETTSDRWCSVAHTCLGWPFGPGVEGLESVCEWIGE